MAADRRHVFVGKVLEKLFPGVPCGQEKKAAMTPASKTTPKKAGPRKAGPRKAAPRKMKGGHVPPLTGGSPEVQPGRRFYTVSLPPEGYVPGPPEPHRCTTSEDSSSSDDVGDQDPHDQPKRRRVRKPKSIKKYKSPTTAAVERAGSETQQGLPPGTPPPPRTHGPAMSRNKKRKLKKKQQMRRKKAAGGPARASGVTFTYQPEDGPGGRGAGDGGRDDVTDAAGEDVADTRRDDITDAAGEDSADARRDDVRDAAGEDGADARSDDVTDAQRDDLEGAEDGDDGTQEKADRILNFLRSTQELFFYDGAARDADTVISETTEELLRCLETGSVSPSDVCLLDRMKTLLLLQDSEGLQSALDAFPELCTMPPEHARVISAFFNYWITHILPEKDFV